ncbi:hypothetical protein UPYG_G00050850 [Umbra pygmaea]|uniref:Glycine N-acyltransferase-like protein n=1 Tax=Umbra pygmaea TaxID=75934 RepID=A0ABD0XUG5_UMBPY
MVTKLCVCLCGVGGAILLKMKILDTDEMQDAEIILQSHLPLCMQVFGFLFSINRNKPHALEVVVDSWPDFQVIICRPNMKNKDVKEFRKRVSFFCTDEEVFKRMVTEENAIDWSSDLLFCGVDIRDEPMLQEVYSSKGDNMKCLVPSHSLRLSDPTLLPQLNSRYVVHPAGAQRTGPCQSPDKQHVQETPCSGIPSVCCCRGGKHCVLQPLCQPGFY